MDAKVNCAFAFLCGHKCKYPFHENCRQSRKTYIFGATDLPKTSPMSVLRGSQRRHESDSELIPAGQATLWSPPQSATTERAMFSGNSTGACKIPSGDSLTDPHGSLGDVISVRRRRHVLKHRTDGGGGYHYSGVGTGAPRRRRSFGRVAPVR